MLQSSQDISDNDYEDDAPTQLANEEPALSKEEQERIRYSFAFYWNYTFCVENF